jgi:hypothetical protein
MNKDFWGPSIWFSIHFAAAGLKPENIHSYRNFIYSLPFLLPCKTCKEHLNKNLSKYVLDNYLNKLYWSWMLHDAVNTDLKKWRPTFQICDYYIQNSGNKYVWGPPMWKMIHSIAATYTPTPENAKAFRQFINSLPGLITCQNCKHTLLELLKTIPLRDDYHLKDSKTLFLWSYNLHDRINRMLGKSSPNYEAVKKFYFNEKCERC